MAHTFGPVVVLVRAAITGMAWMGEPSTSSGLSLTGSKISGSPSG